MRRLLVLVGALALAVGGDVPARAAGLARPFTVGVAAFPVEPAPGLNQTSLGVRPAATRANLGNPPATAYGRAAAYDLGTIELYTGPPPSDTVAECDTGSPNIPDQATAAPAGMTLAATCTEQPVVDVSAHGSSYSSGGLTASSVSSHATADGSGDVIHGDATVTVHGASFGPLMIDTVSTRASVSAGGVPGTAAASGRVVASGATVNGTPVVIGDDGIEVDRQRVPLDLVPSATQAVQAALSQGGYADVRAVQPATAAAADGTTATVKGGGVMLFFNRNDPAQNYFIRLTFGGVDLAVAVGAPLGGPPAAATSPSPAGGDDRGSTVFGSDQSTGTFGAAPAPPAPPQATTAARPLLTVGRRTYDLPEPWQGWPAVLAVSAAAAVGGWLARRRVLGWWELNADRYLRG